MATRVWTVKAYRRPSDAEHVFLFTLAGVDTEVAAIPSEIIAYLGEPNLPWELVRAGVKVCNEIISDPTAYLEVTAEDRPNNRERWSAAGFNIPPELDIRIPKQSITITKAGAG